MITVPFVDLTRQHVGSTGLAVRSQIESMVATSDFVLGSAVEQFERDFAAYCTAQYCVGVGSGTDAVELMLRASGMGSGSEIILPANTFIATAAAVRRAGGRPVPVDVDPEHLLIDPAAVEETLTPRTFGAIAVHLFGQMAPMEKLEAVTSSIGIRLFEDFAQAHGARRGSRMAGSWGSAGGTSFYPSKNLGCWGDGGAVVTSDAALASQVRLLRNHGSETKHVHSVIGFNSRLDTIQALVLQNKLVHLDVWNDARRVAARRYQELLSDVEDLVLPQVAPGNEHVWHLYVVRVPRRDLVWKRMLDLGIQVGIHYPVPIHRQPSMRGRRILPVAETAAREILSLPMYPGIESWQQEAVAVALRKALK